MNVSARWQQCSKRERLGLLLMAAVLTAAALWYFIWLPLAERSEAAWAAQAEQVLLARRLANARVQAPSEPPFTADQLHAYLIEVGLVVKRMDVSAARVQMTVEGEAAAVWQCLEQLDRSALSLETVKLERDQSRLRLTLTVEGLARPA